MASLNLPALATTTTSQTDVKSQPQTAASKINGSKTSTKETQDKQVNEETANKKKPTAESNQPSTEELFNLINANTTAHGGMVAGGDVAGTASAELPNVEPNDDLKAYNKAMFKFNDKLDTYIAKPVARLYTKIMPRPLFNMVNNFFMNLDTVPTVINDALQANFYQFTSDTWRLAINSTFGVGGTLDVATDMGLQYNYEDFGLTMAKWGWTSSSYFIIPILGPSTIRDALGRAVNYFLSPFPYLPNQTWEYSLYGAYLLNERAQFLKAQGVYDSAALDPYVFMRNAYVQRCNYLIQRNSELNNPYTKKDMKRYYNPYYLYQ